MGLMQFDRERKINKNLLDKMTDASNRIDVLRGKSMTEDEIKEYVSLCQFVGIEAIISTKKAA